MAFAGISDEQAKEMLRGDMERALGEVLDIVRAAEEAGFFITYVTGKIGGQQQIVKLDIVKRL